MTRKYRNIIFLQGDDGREIVDRLERVVGVVARGATDATVDEAIAALVEFDYGEGEWESEPGEGTRDYATERDVNGTPYRLSWNLGLGYVGLSEVVES